MVENVLANFVDEALEVGSVEGADFLEHGKVIVLGPFLSSLRAHTFSILHVNFVSDQDFNDLFWCMLFDSSHPGLNVFEGILVRDIVDDHGSG